MRLELNIQASMRIKHKYIRNRHFHVKHWKRIRAKEQPFKTFCPYYGWDKHHWCDAEEQVNRHFEWITQQARALENGQPCFMNAPSQFRRLINRDRKARERAVMAKIRQGDYDAEMPKFKKDANWLYW